MISKEAFLEALESTLEKILTNKPNQSIADNEAFSDYGMDSLDQMNMLLEIEDVVKMELGDVDLKENNTPSKLFGYINTHSKQ
jgi:acyl carrier protein